MHPERREGRGRSLLLGLLSLLRGPGRRPAGLLSLLRLLLRTRDRLEGVGDVGTTVTQSFAVFQELDAVQVAPDGFAVLIVLSP